MMAGDEIPYAEPRQGLFPLWPEAASENAKLVDAAFLGLLAISSFIVLLLLFLVLYGIFNHKSGDKGIGKRIMNSSGKLEFGWSFLPLLIFCGLFAWGADIFIDAQKPQENARDIYVVGRQWMWQAHYPDGRVEHNRLTLAKGEPARIILTSEDVIHSFFVPAFRQKQDVVPGKYVFMSATPSKAGLYDLYCSEYCGTEHSGMVGKVRVLEAEDYAAWTAKGEGEAIPSLAERGGRLFRSLGCGGCHNPDSQIHAPSLNGLYGRLVPLKSGGFIRADVAYLRDSVLLPGKHVVEGYEDIMPRYSDNLDEDDVVALVEYIRSLADGEEEAE